MKTSIRIYLQYSLGRKAEGHNDMTTFYIKQYSGSSIRNYSNFSDLNDAKVLCNKIVTRRSYLNVNVSLTDPEGKLVVIINKKYVKMIVINCSRQIFIFHVILDESTFVLTSLHINRCLPLLVFF